MPVTGTEEKKRTFINMSIKKKKKRDKKKKNKKTQKGRKEARKKKMKRCFKNNQAHKCLETEIYC